MIPADAADLCNLLCDSVYLVVVLTAASDPEVMLASLATHGYRGYIRTTAHGNELVITNRVTKNPRLHT